MNMPATCAPRTPWSDAHLASTFGMLQSQWLTRPGALTAGLRTLGELGLTVLREYADTLNEDEAWMIQAQPKDPVWVREIFMSIDGTACVTARSFTPLEASHQCWQGIRGLVTRPLADMLYHNSAIKRSPFWVCALDRHQPLYQTVQLTYKHDQSSKTSKEPLLARCSTFWYQNKPLLVAECFLPQFWSIAAQETRT